MRRLMSVFLCLALTSNLALARAHKKAGAQKPDRAAQEKELVDLEEKLIESVVKADVATFNKLSIADSLSADGTGFLTHADFAKAMPQIKVTASKVTNAKVQWVDHKTAVVYYTWTGAGTMMGQPLPSPTYASSVWTKRDGRWVCVFHQESTAVTPPAK
jgi:hypothetical protein